MAASSSGMRPRSTPRSRPGAHQGQRGCRPVRVADLARPQRAAAVDQLVARWTARRPEPAARPRTVIAPISASTPRCAGVSTSTGGHTASPGWMSPPAGRTLVARRDGPRAIVDGRRRRTALVQLDHHHRVGAVGHRRAGHDPHRLARADPGPARRRCRPAGADHAATRTGESGVAPDASSARHGEAVHRGVGERRHRLGRRRSRSAATQPSASASGQATRGRAAGRHRARRRRASSSGITPGPGPSCKLDEELAELGAEVVAIDGQLDGGPQVVELLADVVAALGEDVAVDGLLAEQQRDGVGELDLAADARAAPARARRRSRA